MKIASNPIGLRLTTDSEKQTALSMIVAPHNAGGFSPSMGIPTHVLVSETAFPGTLSFYAAIINGAGELESAGWIGIGKC